MKQLKRILFFTLALLFVCYVPVNGVEAASKITAQSVLKDALYKKQENKDQVVVSLKVNADIDKKIGKQKTHEKLRGNSSIQIKGKNYVGVLNYKDTTGDLIDELHQYKKYDSKMNKLSNFINEDGSNTYYRIDTVGDDSNKIVYDYKKLYPYLSDIKFVKKLTTKNGQKAYCVSAKFDCAKYLSNEDSYRDAFASSILTLFSNSVKEKGIYAKTTVYIDQTTGKLISMKFDMNQYIKTNESENFKGYTGYGNEDKNSDYSIQVKSTDSYILMEFNPKKYDKITMPSNYKVAKFTESGELQSETTYKNNKKSQEELYYEDSYISAAYDKKGILVSEIKTKYADEYSIKKEYKNGELTNTTKIERADSITVSNVKQFLNAIGKYNLIYLKEGEYNLSDIQMSRDDDQAPNISVNSTYDGYEYIFDRVDHLTLIGKGKASIVIEPRYSTVLNIVNSKDVTLKNLTIGHTTAKGECAGGVLYFENSSKITIDSCNLYGCGILGITTNNVDDLKMTDSQIYDCTYGIMSLTNTKNAKFLNCKFRDNEGFDMINLDGCTSIIYDQCQIYNNIRAYEYGDNFIESNNNSKITFQNCDIHDNSQEYNLTADDDIEFKDCKIE